MSHAVLPPSSAHIWGTPDGCSGWVGMAAQFPELESSPEAMGGDASHWVAEQLIGLAAKGTPGTADLFVGKPAPNGIIITDEMFEGAELYANDVLVTMRQTGVFVPQVEQRVNMPDIHPENWGTPDCRLYDRKGGVLYLWDYKFGHRIVEAFENYQAINYVAGIFEELGIDGTADQYLTVVIRIAQPRAFHRDGPIREWRIMASELRGYFNHLRNGAAKSLSARAECHTGTHCKNCEARHACPAALQAGLGMLEVATMPVPQVLDPNALGVQLSIIKRALKQLECLETGFEEQVKALVKSGKFVPGWIAEQGTGRKRWTKTPEEVIAMGKLFEADLANVQAVTPNQAGKLGIDEAVITAYSEIPRTALKVVADNKNRAKQIFTQPRD